MLRALDAMNNLGSLMTSRTTSRELKATNAMNNSRLWMTSKSLKREYKALMKISRE